MTKKQTRPMTRILTGITLAALLAGSTVAGVSVAQEHQRGEGKQGERGGMMMERGQKGERGHMKHGYMHGGERMAEHRERMAERLDLDEEQRALWDEFHEHMGPRHDREQRRDAMQEMMDQGFTDRLGRMERWSAEHAERMGKAREAGERLYEALDEEQRQKLDEAPRQMREHMREYREDRRGNGQRQDGERRGGQGQGGY